MNEFSEIFKNYAHQAELEINNQQISLFNIYLEFLLEYNSHTNLTAITEPGIIAVKHFIDSMLLSKVIKFKSMTNIIDIGTGAGFPGVPLKILFPEISLTLVDSLNKRINFLNELKSKLGIEYSVFHKRAEELSRDENYRDKFDCAVSRAVASLNVLMEYCMPFVKKDGFFVSMKGPDVDEELKNADTAIKVLGGQLERVQKLTLPGGCGKRSVILIKKIKLTDEMYPRQTAKIIKKPL